MTSVREIRENPMSETNHNTADDSLSREDALRQERTANCPLRNCPQHLEEEMVLRCIRTDRLLCMECAVHTPTGYIAKEVARAHDDKFFKGTQRDVVLQIAVCGIGMAIVTAILRQMGLLSFFIIIFIGPVVGGALTDLALRLTQRRRGRYSDVLGAAAVAIGGFTGAFLVTFLSYQSGQADFVRQFNPDQQAAATYYAEMMGNGFSGALRSVLADIWLLAFLALATVAAYGRFKVRI